MPYSKEKIKLILPSLEMKNRAMDFRSEFIERGEKIHGSCGMHHYGDFTQWLNIVRQTAVNPPEGHPHSTTYFGIRVTDNSIVGVINIRHYLREEWYHNGHIGYSVRPSERNRGYASEMLRQALIKAEQAGIMETVVTCNRDNRASRKVIENNGLSFEREFLEDNGNTVLIYHTDII